MLFKAYRYFYYRNYAFYLKRWGKDAPQFNALLVVSFLFFVNLLNVRLIIEALLGRPLYERSLRDRPYVFAVFGLVLLAHYFLLIHHGRYKKIAEEFRGESPTQRRSGLIGVWLYAAGSLAFYFALA
jgi:hypothetical protein